MSSNIEHSLLIYDVITPTTVTSVVIEQLSGCLSDAREVGKKNNILIAERNQQWLWAKGSFFQCWRLEVVSRVDLMFDPPISLVSRIQLFFPDTDSSDNEFIPTELSDLSVRELVAYKFGVFVLALLRNRRGTTRNIDMLVAEKLPATNLSYNAFRGSFW